MFHFAAPLFTVLFSTLSTFSVSEVTARLKRSTDFPTYDANNRIGYIPKPNQSGSFKGQGQWAFNELSMGVPRPFAPTSKQNILLIGDSLVFGSLNFKHTDRLWYHIEHLSNSTIWPISAGSWALQNEVQYLSDHPDVVAAVDRIVFVLNTDDFKGPSSWYSERQKPTKRPISAVVHLLEKTRPVPRSVIRDTFKVVKRNAVQDLFDLLQTTDVPVDIWLYPRAAELSDPVKINACRKLLSRKLGERVRIFDVSSIDGWKKSLYHDSIHPKKSGVLTLAKGIAKIIRQTEAPSTSARSEEHGLNSAHSPKNVADMRRPDMIGAEDNQAERLP